jgi:uncharacterized membrane protein
MMRHWEIDFTRGLLVLLMILFNWSYTLLFLDICKISDSVFYWWLFPRMIGAGFIFIAGVSFSISYAKNPSLKKHAKRGAFIFALGMAITLVTFLMYPEYTILFGILHLIGLSIIAGIFAIRYDRRIALAAGAAIVLFGFFLQTMRFDFPYLLWLGLMPEAFRTFDYFPLIPWLGFFLIGIAAGKYYEKRKASRGPAAGAPLGFIGRHSLVIYLLHQPVLLAALYVLSLL